MDQQTFIKISLLINYKNEKKTFSTISWRNLILAQSAQFYFLIADLDKKSKVSYKSIFLKIKKCKNV